MKNIILVGIVGAVLGGMTLGYLNEPTEAVNPKTVIEEVHPDWATDEEAVSAAKDVIQRKAWEADKERLQGQIEALQTQYKTDLEVLQTDLDTVDKQLGVYWRNRDNLVRLIRQTFPETPNTAVAVAMAESGMVMQQSRHKYPKDMDGQKAGSRERSWCIYQIHEPAHHATAVRLGYENYKTDVEDCVKMARVVYEQAGNSFKPWTVYTKNMHLAYVR